MKRLLAGLACTLALAGCASDPYYYGGYGSYGSYGSYGYYATPSYDYATPYYYYDYGYPYYGYPAFGGGLSLHYYDYDRNDHRWRDRGRWRDRDNDGRWRGDDRNDDRPPTGNLGRSAPSDFGGTRGGPVMANPVPPGQRPDAAGR
jgi:hypothetical protein